MSQRRSFLPKLNEWSVVLLYVCHFAPQTCTGLFLRYPTGTFPRVRLWTSCLRLDGSSINQFLVHMRPLLVTIMGSKYESLPVHISALAFPFFLSFLTWRCWHSQIYTWGSMRPILSLKSSDASLVSRQRTQERTENVGCWFWTWPKRTRCRTNQKANWMFFSLSFFNRSL